MKKKILVIAVVVIIALVALFITIAFSPKQKLKPQFVFPTPTPFSGTSKPTEPVGLGPAREFVLKQEETIRNERPDVYLSNALPHEETLFSMTAFPDPVLKKFRFTVAMKGQDNTKSKNDAYLWMRSTRLTDQQIQSLAITYLPDVVVKLKERLPYDGEHFSLDYDRDPDKTTAAIYDGSLGEEEFNAFLKANGISNRSLINNLTILYR